MSDVRFMLHSATILNMLTWQYKQAKARALELQRQKEIQLKRELAEKAERDKQRAKDEEEVRCGNGCL